MRPRRYYDLIRVDQHADRAVATGMHDRVAAETGPAAGAAGERVRCGIARTDVVRRVDAETRAAATTAAARSVACVAAVTAATRGVSAENRRYAGRPTKSAEAALAALAARAAIAAIAALTLVD